jgi:ATPase family associated with various cellular activities (AAA)
MAAVKQRLEAAVLAPMRHLELGRLYGKSLRGGLLLYRPPGCGKTFIARALAGEIEARFMAVSLVDVLDMFIGQSERNLHELADDPHLAPFLPLLCVHDTRLPWGELYVAGAPIVPVLTPSRLVATLCSLPAHLDPVGVMLLAEHVRRQLHPAV